MKSPEILCTDVNNYDVNKVLENWRNSHLYMTEISHIEGQVRKVSQLLATYNILGIYTTCLRQSPIKTCTLVEILYMLYKKIPHQYCLK